MDIEHIIIAVAFISFIALSYRFVQQYIKKQVTQKIASISADIKSASEIRDKSINLLVSLQRQRQEADSIAMRIVQEAEEEAKFMIEEANKKAQMMNRNKLEMSLKRAENIQIEMLRDLKGEIVDETIELIRAQLKDNLDEREHQKIIKNAMCHIESQAKSHY